MSMKLHEAIQATRAGETRQAQLLLTQVLKEDQSNVHAWFLLSHLVDSEPKQVAYLRQALTLDPDHQKARQWLARLHSAGRLQTEAAPQITLEDTQPQLVIPQASAIGATALIEDEALPDWLRDEPVFEEEEAAPITDEVIPAEDGLEQSISHLTLEEMPDQSQVTAVAGSAAAEAAEPLVIPPLPTQEMEAPAAAGAKAASGPKPQPAQPERLNRLLTGLVAAAVIVMILLLYMVFTTF